ncbi:hypothetical protein HanXRQr2_Chr16g0756821 [Helianthus annuus]|uniref:Uncharacterized protein n=1 Tax=Helianthus annuus TaxID=4232 RepID=A0A9K3DUI6_HELAN|nr:hypothetical protein HanXRQr2_Chr16g0756821 [Helianthus annuus]KAJ0821876.1 hypothetical protein HanPSC8_Chr16g0725331 [Helianthus annuus]
MCLDRPYLRFHGFFTKDLVFQPPNQPTHSRIQVEDLQNHVV